MNVVSDAEREFLDILRKTCRTMRQSRNRPELAIPAAEWEMKINERLTEVGPGPEENGKEQTKAA